MRRCLQPEQLDILSASDPLARGSRRDLRRVNAWMRNAGLAASCLGRCILRAPPLRIVDLGAGDGSLLLRLTQRLPALAPGTELVLVDRREVVDEDVVAELRSRGFRPRLELEDAWDWLRAMREQCGTWVVANLFLHHFSREELRGAFEVLAAKVDLCFACEPRRAAWPLVASHLLWLIGANRVTRHDAVVSVRAGFAERELSGLWPANPGWHLEERDGGFFSHLFLAERIGPAKRVSA